MIIGKAVGVTAGLVVNWFPQGVIIGLVLGILADELLLKKMMGTSKETFWMQEFSCLYLELMAVIARAKGRISQADIHCIREHAYIESDAKHIANRILKRSKKSRKTFNYLISEVKLCCEGAEEMFAIIGQGAVQLGYLQGTAGRVKVDKLFMELGLPPVDWSKAPNSQNSYGSRQARSQSNAGGTSGEYQDDADRYEENPHVTRAYGKKSPYAVLGLKDTATPAELKKAYRNLIQKYHPDKVRAAGKSEKAIDAAEKKVAEINAAYEVLQKKKRP